MREGALDRPSVMPPRLDREPSSPSGPAARGYTDRTANVSLDYRVAAWSVQLQERYIDEVLLNRTWVEGVDVDDNTIPSRAWTNLVLGYGRDMGGAGNWRVSLSLQNLFDKEPPFAIGTQYNYDPGSGNPLGRVFVVGVRKKF